jgi:hypothetical protein
MGDAGERLPDLSLVRLHAILQIAQGDSNPRSAAETKTPGFFFFAGRKFEFKTRQVFSFQEVIELPNNSLDFPSAISKPTLRGGDSRARRCSHGLDEYFHSRVGCV